MTHEEFDKLVRSIETRFAGKPRRLGFRIALIVALGYALFIAMIIGGFGIGALLLLGAWFVDDVFGGIVLLVLGVGLIVVTALQAISLLWVETAPPEGKELTPELVPKFFYEIDKLRAATQSVPVHRVILSGDFNASVIQIPRLGIFGWPTNYLEVGLPLMEFLSADELRGVLAHEFAHLSARDGFWTGWLYRLRRSWEQMFATLNDGSNSSQHLEFLQAVVGFFRWYWPRFNAHAFVLSREREYAADRTAAECAGRELQSALWKLENGGRRLEDEIWPRIRKLAADNPEPPFDITEQLHSSLRQLPAETDAERWMEQSLRTLTGTFNTHPSFSDRIRSLGGNPVEWRAGEFPVPPPSSSATSYLGENLEALRGEVNALWKREATPAWRGRYGQVALHKRQIATLGEPVESADASIEILWERARKVVTADGAEAAEPLLRRILAVKPSHSGANFTLGQHLIDRGNLEGEQFLSRILERDDDELISPACDILIHHYRTSGNVEQVQQLIARQSRYQEAVTGARQERLMVTAADSFLPHELTDAELASLWDVLSRQPELCEAHLVRKELKYFRQQRLFVLCVASRRGGWFRSNSDRDEGLVRALIPDVKLPGRVVIISPQGVFRALAKKIRGRPDAQIDLQAFAKAADLPAPTAPMI